MNDDWRVQVAFENEGLIEQLVDQLEARELEEDLSTAFEDRVIVSRDGERLFLYAGTRDQAERARDHVLELVRRHDWHVRAELTHWHPAAEEWEDPDAPLPPDGAGRRTEHEALIAREREETAERGWPEMEVRVDLPSRHDAAAFAERLRGEGLPALHRWKFLLVGATDEDAARQLAARIEAEAPAGSTVAVEGTWRAVYGERPPNPFAFLGGLGG